MIGYRSIGESEFLYLIHSENPVYGTRKWNTVKGSGCPELPYGSVCFYLDPYAWHDKRHIFDIEVEIPDNSPTGIATYWAGSKLETEHIFYGSPGKHEYKIREAYPRFYLPSGIIRIKFHGYYADHFFESTINPFCEKYAIIVEK